jgi:signal transduction histidine kinase
MQVVLNLLSNALKFTDEGGIITISSKLLVKAEKNFIEISVQDTGVGISKDNQKKLFKHYGFLETTKERNHHGVGLGLSIS